MTKWPEQDLRASVDPLPRRQARQGRRQNSYRRFGLVRRRVPLRQPSRIIVRERGLPDASCHTNALSAGSMIDMRKYLWP
jgi:hypothetical protein